MPLSCGAKAGWRASSNSFGRRSRAAPFARTEAVARQRRQSWTAKGAERPFPRAPKMSFLGGDGFMLETLHRTFGQPVAIYGMNCGTVGFLMNEFDDEGLLERLAQAEEVRLHPLRMRSRSRDGRITEALAINEVALFRESR